MLHGAYGCLCRFQMKMYMCLLCEYTARQESVYVHVYKNHVGGPAPVQCGCGFVAMKKAGLVRHLTKSGCTEKEERTAVDIPREKFLRRCTRAEMQPYVPTSSFTLDYHDWEMAEGGEDVQWVKEKELEEKNRKLEKEIENLKRINDALASELLTPAVGAPVDYALSGFDAAWEEQQQIQRARKEKETEPTVDLFPDPPQRLSSAISVPPSNRHLSRNERIWKRCSEDAITSYNKKHRR